MSFWRGVLATLLTIGLLELVARVWTPVQAPATVLLLPIAYAAFTGGLLPGLLSATISILYTGYFFSEPGDFFRFTPDHLQRFLIALVMSVLMTLLADKLRLRSVQLARAQEDLRLAEEERRTEKERHVTEAKFAGIIAIASDAIISTDAEQKILNFNRGAEEIFGFTAQEVVGRPLEILLPARFQHAHGAHVRSFGESQVTSRRMGERREISGVRKNGEEFPAEASISKLDVDSERIYTVVLRDITVRKRYEQTQHFLANAGTVLSASLDPAVTLDNIANVIVPAFADACVIFTREPDGSMGRALERGAAELLALIPDDEPQSTDTTVRQLGERSVIVAPMTVRDELSGAVGLVRSPPARPYDEEDVALAADVARRAALALDNARLYRSAQSAIQARDDVLAVVSHDLGNPLSAIRIGTTLLLSSVPEEERETGGWKHIVGIRNSAEQMERLIKDLLEVKRIEAGQLAVERGRVAVAPLVLEAVELLTPIAEGKKINLVPRVDGNALPIYADRERLLQIFSNLVGNAVKFTPEGGEVWIAAQPNGEEMNFTIADNGIGISPENLPHVFDRYWQAAARKKGRQGIGLGLVIVTGIVKAHSGRVWVESEVGKGTSVHFTVPLWKNQISE